MADKDAIEAIKHGDKERYSELVKRYEAMVYGIAWSRLGDPHLCQDAAQETFVKAYRYLAALRHPEKFPSWLAQIARNVSTSILRSRRREIDNLDRWKIELHTNAEPETTAPETNDALRSAMEDLDAHDRESLVLFYVEAKSIREAASILGISEGAMKTRLYRARNVLRGMLEQRLEKSLERLRPPKNFSGGVMALLPAMPLGASIGIPAILVKVASVLTGIGNLLAIVLPLAFNAALFRWFVRLERSNLKAGPGHEYRRRMAATDALVMFMMGIAAMVVTFFGLSMTSPNMRNFYMWLAAYCLVPTYRVTRNLRINRSAFMWGQALFCYGMLAAVVAIGFLGAPLWTFFVFLVPMNGVAMFTHTGAPVRRDHNLFLRYALGTLAAPESTPYGHRQYTRTELMAFARFMGHRALADDVFVDAAGIRIALPAARVSFRKYAGLLDSNSTIRIDYDGTIEASMGRRDARDLRRLTRITEVEMPIALRAVEDAVRASLHEFLAGAESNAEQALQTEPSADVFKTAPRKSLYHRARVSLATIAGILLLGFSLYAANMAKPSVVTQEQAVKVFNAWCAEVDLNANKNYLIHHAPIRPPLAFFDEPGRQNYLQLVREELRGRWEDTDKRIIEALFRPKALYFALEDNLLTDVELEHLGFTPESICNAVANAGTEWLSRWTDGTFDLEAESYRIAILARLDCLDLLSTDALVDKVASTQVIDGWRPTEHTKNLDTEWAHGLFAEGVFPLCDTRSALWILEMLGRLDAIDRDACLAGIMRFYDDGGGVIAKYAGPTFTSFSMWRDIDVPIYGRQEDLFYAMESLYILGALDRIENLAEWEFKAEAFAGDISVHTLLSFAYEYRLNELREKLARRDRGVEFVE